MRGPDKTGRSGFRPASVRLGNGGPETGRTGQGPLGPVRLSGPAMPRTLEKMFLCGGELLIPVRGMQWVPLGMRTAGGAEPRHFAPW